MKILIKTRKSELPGRQIFENRNSDRLEFRTQIQRVLVPVFCFYVRRRNDWEEVDAGIQRAALTDSDTDNT